MARRKVGDKQAADQKTVGTGGEEKTRAVQADHNSVAIGGIGIGGDLSGEMNIAAEQVSLLLTQITTTLQPKPFDGRCPYKGLEVFEEEDAELFFGRERLVVDLLGRVKESRTVFITGPSGSGKSSLVRAGLIHALKQGGIKNLLRGIEWYYKRGIRKTLLGHMCTAAKACDLRIHSAPQVFGFQLTNGIVPGKDSEDLPVCVSPAGTEIAAVRLQ